MLKVLFVAAEATPFVKSGGLGDVVGTLPKELKKQGVDVRVMIPKYGNIPVVLKNKMHHKTSLTVSVGWRRQFCGIDEIEYNDIHFYFIDNEYYFKRQGLYGFYDEAERFTFFCRAVLETLPQIEFVPDILHCHDWHSGMVSTFLQAKYKVYPEYRNIKTLFTIHNLKYQGVFPKEILSDLLELGWEYFNIDGIEFYDQVNFMKGGIVFSDLISTVSKTYAQEIKYPFFGEMLEGILQKRESDLYGVINGIDYEIYNPKKDSKICYTYSLENLEIKVKNKIKLQEMLKLPERENVPLIAIISRLVAPKGLDLVACILHEIMGMDVQMVVLGTGDAKYQDLFLQTAGMYPDKMSANIIFDDSFAHQVYAGSDLFLMPSLYEPCGIGQLIAMRYGSIPIVRETGGLKDTIQSYNEYTGQGNGFSFSNYNAHDLLFTIRRAVTLFYDKKMWYKVVANAMRLDYSWKESAMKYKKIYQHLTTIGG